MGLDVGNTKEQKGGQVFGVRRIGKAAVVGNEVKEVRQRP